MNAANAALQSHSPGAPAAATPRRLEARGLGFGYRASGSQAAAWQLRDVSITLETGLFTGIVGPNGAGKSTLLYLLARQLAPREGSIKLDGRALAEFGRRELARAVSILPQSVETPFAYTCQAVVEQGRYPHQGPLGITTAEDLAVVERCLAWTAATELRHRAIDELSGGERQRVLLASVLAQEAALILLDEPTTALDADHQIEVFERLAALARGGCGVCVVTHDLNLAARYCDTMVVLREGRVAARGTPGEVMREDVLRGVYRAPLAVAADPVTGAPMAVMLGSSRSLAERRN